jgi:DnaK suppressor protein
MATRKPLKKKKMMVPKSASALKKKASDRAKKKMMKIPKSAKPPTRSQGEKTIKIPTEMKGTMKPTIPEKNLKGEQEEIRQMLLNMRKKLFSEISQTRLPEAFVPSSEIGDLVDQAGDERDRELSLLLTSREKEKLQAIDEALEKLAEGTYGICEECGEKIGAGRLKVMPLAKSCVNCQQKLEKEISLQKKVEEESTYRGLAYAQNLEEEEA